MAFCKLTAEAMASSRTAVDNIFVIEYLQNLSGDAVKAYIFGVFAAENLSTEQNTLENFSKSLKMSEQQLIDAFRELEAEGLVQIISAGGFEVRVLPIRDVVHNVAKHSTSKYKDFNKQIQAIIEGRMITPSEYSRYYDVIEVYKIESDALLLIAKYATTIKGGDVGYNYITTIAKNWAMSGAKTVKEVSEKLLAEERNFGAIKKLFDVLKIKSSASFDERAEYVRWKQELGFDDNLILFAAGNIKGAKPFLRLAQKLKTYAALELKSEKEIEAYEKTKTTMLELSKKIVKRLGLYYESHEQIIETYVSAWLAKGFDEAVLESVAAMCFKQGIRSLEGMNDRIEVLYKKGVLSTSGFLEYAQVVSERDKQIKNVLLAAGIDRTITNQDRAMYNTWVHTWQVPSEVVLIAAKKASGALNAFSYINKILENLKTKNCLTLDAAKKELEKTKTTNTNSGKKVASDYSQNTYTAEQLNSVFADINKLLEEDSAK